MPADRRAHALAQHATDLAAAAGTTLPDSLSLWHLAGERPAAAPTGSADPGRCADGDLGAALEATLSDGERRAGAHFTPPVVAERVAAMALGPSPSAATTVVDPTCGGGALLLAGADALVRAGADRRSVARDLLWGADLDPLAIAVTEAAIALWSGGTAPAAGHLVVADTLRAGLDAWPAPPAEGFGALVGNPPFQGQLGRGTVRSRDEAKQLRERFGGAAAGYVDTAALFLLAALDLVAPGGSVAMVLPQSVAAARDAAPVRSAVASRAELREVWAAPRHVFDAKVHVCVVALDVPAVAGTPASRAGDGWAPALATARGVPDVSLRGERTIADLAVALAGFRDEYYGLVGHVREAVAEPKAPLVTSGCIDVGTSTWGEAPIRFAKQRWLRPDVDLAAVAEADPRVGAWVERLRRPKVLVASQTRVIEAVADSAGTWVPSTPVVSVLPHDGSDVERVAAVLCAPLVSAWAARRAVGTALSASAIRVSSSLVLEVPLPVDEAAWHEATAALAAGDLVAYAQLATDMYALTSSEARAVLAWWHAHRPRPRPRAPEPSI